MKTGRERKDSRNFKWALTFDSLGYARHPGQRLLRSKVRVGEREYSGGFILKPLVISLHPYVALFDFPGRPSGDLGAHLR